MLGGLVELYYGGGSGGGYLIGSGLENVEGKKSGSYNKGGRGFLGDVGGMITGKGPSTTGDYGSMIGGVLGGAMGSGGGSGFGGSSVGSGGAGWSGWGLGGGNSNVSGLTSLFGGGGTQAPAYGMSTMDGGAMTVDPSANTGSTTSSLGGLSSLMGGGGSTGGTGSGISLGQIQQGLGILGQAKGLLGGGGGGGQQQPIIPPPIQRTPQSQTAPITPQTTPTVTPTPQLAGGGMGGLTPQTLIALRALLGGNGGLA